MIFSESLDQCVSAARKYVVAVAVSLVACVTPLSAQEQLTAPKVEGKFIFGSATFGEDIEHKIVGGAVRVHVARRFSIEPEYLYMRHSENDQDHVVQSNVVYDFADPKERFVPYGIIGVGVLHHKGRFVDNDFTTWTLTVGGGARIYVTKKLFVSPELRLGREPTVRATINVGYVFGGRR